MNNNKHYFWLCKCGNIYTCGYSNKLDTKGSHCYCDGNISIRFGDTELNNIEETFDMKYGLSPAHEITKMQVMSLTRENFRKRYGQYDPQVEDYDEEDYEEEDIYF